MLKIRILKSVVLVETGSRPPAEMGGGNKGNCSKAKGGGNPVENWTQIREKLKYGRRKRRQR